MLKTISFTKIAFSYANAKIYWKTISKSNFLTCKAKLAFLLLRQAFTEALIVYYFDLKRYIQIETNICGYTIDNQSNPEFG